MGPLVTTDVKPKSTVCRRELKQNQANSNRRTASAASCRTASRGGGRPPRRLDAAPAPGRGSRGRCERHFWGRCPDS